MYPKTFLFLSYALGGASLISGWFQFYWWLVVPPLAFFFYAFCAVELTNIHNERYGVSGDWFRRSMIGPNLALIIRNTIIHSTLFAATWAVSSLFG